MKADALWRNPASQGCGKFAAGCDIKVQAEFGNPAGDFGAQESLARVIDLGL